MSVVPSHLWANPVGEQVVAGAATFQRVGNSLTIQQGTDRAVINWNQFSIGAGETTKFVMPNASSAALNRVLSGNPSAIYGNLQANGHLFLINPAGVLVGPGGTIQAGSFIASTRDVATETFMRGGDLSFLGESGASILNQGKIEAQSGDVFLIAQHVENEGQLMAKDGTVGMVSGTQVSLQSVGPHHFKVRLMDIPDEAKVKKDADGTADLVNDGVIEAANAVLEATGNVGSLAINNRGTIRATGVKANADGSVTLTGGEGDVLNSGVIAALRKNMNGEETGGQIQIAGRNITAEASSLVTAAGAAGGGKIQMRATDTTLISGRVEATGYADQAKGGRVELLGRNVGLRSGEVNADGGAKGGTVLVGGDYLGLNPEVPNAKATVMTPDARISANATVNGDGGKVILWSDEYTGFFGRITALGGPEGGNGGFIETSSKNNLQAFGEAQASAPKGISGEWLLDPRNVTITTAATSRGVFSGSNPDIFTPTADDATVLNTEINNALNQGTSVTITTGTTGTQDGNILVNAPISKSQGEAVRLTFSAANNITVNDTIQSTGAPLYLDFFADADGNGAGNFILNQILTTRTGDVTISAAGLAGFGAGVTINTTGITTGGQEIAGDVFLRPSQDNVAIGVGTGVGAFTVSDSVLDAMSVFAAEIPGTVAIGSRKSGNLQVGGVTFNNKNLSLITGGAITGFSAENAGDNVNTDGLLTLDAAGSIGTNIGIGNGLQVNTPRVAIITEGNFFNLYNTATFTQFHVTTDGTVATQRAVDAQPTPNLNWFVTETANPTAAGGNTTINGITVRAGSVNIRYENSLGDILVSGGGVTSTLVNNANLAATGITFSAPDLVDGIQATGTVANVGGFALVTITNPGTGYLLAPTVTLTGGPGFVDAGQNFAGLGSSNVQPANNTLLPLPVLGDFSLSTPLGRISTTVPLFSGGGNLTLQTQDLALPVIGSGSLILTDVAGVELPSIAYDNLGVLNTFEAVVRAQTAGTLTYVGGTFGTRVALLPGQGGAGSISGTGGFLTIEATSASAEGQRVVFAPGGAVPNAMNIGIRETQLMEAPGIRIGGPGTADILLETMITPLIFRQNITTRNPGGNPTTIDIDYDPRYFENPFFTATRNATPPINVRENNGVPHVTGGTVSLVSGRGSTRNVQGGDVNVSALSLTGVDGVFFDARSTSGTYAGLNLTTANGSVIGAISARVGRTVQDITIGNGGDITLNLNATTGFVNDGRLPVDTAFSDFSQIQTAGGTASFDAVTGELNAIAVTGDGGMLYTSDPVVTLTGGGVQEASARAVLSGGGVALIAPQIVGAGYTPSSIIPGTTGETTGPTVTISGNGSGVQVGNGGRAFISDNGIISVFSVINGGSGYDPAAPPQVIISGGGSGVTRAAVARTEVNSAGQVVALIVVDPGAGYDNSPVSVLIQAPDSGGVRATAELDADFRPTNFGNSLNPIYISSAGSGYTVEPTVSFSGGGVKQAQARAIVQTDPSSDRFGRVVGFEITDPGDGYTSAPTVTIGSGQAFGNFGEYGVSTETVDRNLGSGNISISNGPFPVVGGIILNAPIRTGDALGVPGGDAITGSILLDIYVDLGANSNNRSTGAVPNPGGARGIVITGDASIVPTTTSVGNTRSGSVTIVARDISNGTTAASSLYQLTGSAGLPIQIGTATGGISNLTGNLNASLQLRDITNREVGNLQIYAPAPGEVQVALGNVPLDPNHVSFGPRTSNDLFLSGLSTPQTGTDAGGNQRPDESLVSVEVGGFEGKLTLLRRSETQAAATVVNGRVTLITPDQGGQLYVTTPNVIVTGGGVTPAEATVFITGGTLIAPNGSNSLTLGNGIDNAGNGYFTVPTVTFTGGGGAGAEAVAVINSTGQITSIQIINPGYGYTSLPTVVISAPAGVPGAATATVVNQTIPQTSLTVANGGITNPGLGYTTAPLVTITGGRLGTATATAIVDTSTSSSTYSQITGITINLNGDSFPSGAATITIAQPAGQAQATANLINGEISSFTITSPGGGYSSTPNVILTTGTATTPYTLTGDRLGLIADRIQLFDSTTPANVLIEAGLVAVAPWTNQRPVNLGSQQAGATSFTTGDLLRFLADDLVVGRRNSSHIGVGAGEITVSAAVGSDSLRISNGLFLAGTRGLSDRGYTSAGLSFPGLSVNVGSEVNLQGSANALQYLAAIIQGPFAELTEGKSFTLASSLRSSGSNSLPLTVAEIFGNPAYFTGQRFNQGITTQNGNVTLRADLFEQTRLVGFIDTTGGGAIPVSTSTVTLAPFTAARPISIYANSPGTGLALRIGNSSSPGLEQIQAASIKIGSSTAGNITFSSDFGFNYAANPDAPRALILETAGTVTMGISQIPPSPNPIPTTSSILIPALSVNAQSANFGAFSGTTAGPTHLVESLAALLTGAGQAFSFTSFASSLSVVDLSSLGGVQGIQTSTGNVTLTANQINILPMTTSGLASIRAAGARVLLQPRSAQAVQLGVAEPKGAGFNFTDLELHRISAAYLQIGNGSLATSITIAGLMTLSQSISPAITGGLTLVSSGGIQDVGGASGISYSPGNLTLSAGGAISLTGSGNNLGTVAANSGGANITLTSGTPFVVSSSALDPNFSSISGVRGQGATVILQPVGATAIFLGNLSGGLWGFTDSQLNSISAATLQIGSGTAGAILVNSPITLTQGSGINQIGSTFALVSGGTIGDSGGTTGINYAGGLTLTSGGAISFTGTGNDFGAVTAFSSGNNITLASAPFDIASINAGMAIVSLQPIGAVPVVLGNPGSGVWGFSNVELNAVSAGTLRIGTGSVTSLLVNAPLSLTTASLATAFSLISGGTIADTGGVTGVSYSGGGLRLTAVDSVNFSGTGNEISLLAAAVTGAGASLDFGSFGRTALNPLQIGIVDGVVGATTTGGNATISADFLQVLGDIQTGAGNLQLQPITASQSIGLFGGVGDFNIDDGEFDRLLGTGTVTIGRGNGSGNVEVGGKSGITRDLIIQSPAQPTAGTFVVSGAISAAGTDMIFNSGAGQFTANALVDLSNGGALTTGAVTVLARVINLVAAPSLWANGGITLGNKMGDTYVGIPGGAGAMDLEISSASLGNILTTGYVSFGALGGDTSVFLGNVSLALAGFGGLGLFADASAEVQLRADVTIPGSVYVDGPLTLSQPGTTTLTGSSAYLLNGIRGAATQSVDINTTGEFTFAGTENSSNLIGLLDLAGVGGAILFGAAGTASVPAGLVWAYDSFGTAPPSLGLYQQFAQSFVLPKAATLQGPAFPSNITLIGTAGAGLNLSAGMVAGNQDLFLRTTGGGSITTGAVSLSGSAAPLDFEAKVLDGTGALSLNGAVDVSGRVDLRAGTGAVATMGNVIAGTGLRVDADVLSLGGNLTAAQGNVQVTKTTRSEAMLFGSAPGAYLTQAQIFQLSAPNGEVILGSSENTGGIQLAGPLNLSGANANLRYALENNGNINFGSASSSAVLSLRNGGQLRIGAGTGNVMGSGGVDIAGVGATVRVDSAASVALLTDVGFYGPVTTSGPVTLVNLGSVTIGGAFDTGTGNISVRTRTGNLTLAAGMAGGSIQLAPAMNFNNSAGSAPFSNRGGGRTLIYSIGQRFNLPYDFSGLNGFGVAFGRAFGADLPAGNWLAYSSYAQVGLNEGVVYYEMFSGNSVSALLALSPELFWSVNSQMIPKTRSGGYIDYMLYPQRVEPATSALPQPSLSRLEEKLGRPPTVAEIAAEEAERRRNRMLRTGVLMERTSFDVNGQPQAEVNPSIRADRAEFSDEKTHSPQVKIQADTKIPTAQLPLPDETVPQASKPTDRNPEVKSPGLRRGPNRAVVLRSEPLDAKKILAAEREKAEVNLSAPVAGAK